MLFIPLPLPIGGPVSFVWSYCNSLRPPAPRHWTSPPHTASKEHSSMGSPPLTPICFHAFPGTQVKTCTPSSQQESSLGPHPAHLAISIPSPHSPTAYPASTSEPLLCSSLFPACLPPSQLVKLLGILEGLIQTSSPQGDDPRYPAPTSFKINLPTPSSFFTMKTLKAPEKMNTPMPLAPIHRFHALSLSPNSAQHNHRPREI